MIGARRARWSAAVLLALAGCSPDKAGRFMPEPASGIEVTRTRVDGDTANIGRGPVTVRVTGQWSSPGLQYLDVAYTNAGKTSVSIDLAGLSLRREAEIARLDRVSDVTGVDVADVRTDNDEPKVLLSDDAAAPVYSVPPGETRQLLAIFDAFQQGEPLRPDCRVQAAVPTPDGPPARISLRCGD